MLRLATLFCCLLLAAMPGLAKADAAEALAALSEPRTHAIMRHALAPGYSDPANFDVEDCATQRNLNEAGREQARATGRVFRDAATVIDAVWSSRWCRCLETARLLDLGAVTEVPALNSFFENRSERGPQTEALREKLALVSEDTTLMIVTHQVNISALLGRATTSGEVVVFSIGDEGETVERGSFVLPAY